MLCATSFASEERREGSHLPRLEAQLQLSQAERELHQTHISIADTPKKKDGRIGETHMILRPHQKCLPRLPRREAHVEPPDNQRRQQPDLHVREILADAAHRSQAEGVEYVLGLVGHQFGGARGVAFGDEFVKLRV
jgi:hypothetical protein